MVTAARQTIADLGLHGATVRAIAKAGGVSTGSVMHYFADKDAIAHAVLEETNRIAGRRVQAAGKDRRGLDQLRSVVETMLPTNRERLLDWRIWVAFWSEAQETPGGSHGLNAAGLSLGSVVVGALQTAIEDGELPASIDVGFEAGRLITITAGLGLMSGYSSPAQIKRIATRTLDAHIADLRAGVSA